MISMESRRNEIRMYEDKGLFEPVSNKGVFKKRQTSILITFHLSYFSHGNIKSLAMFKS